ncbi:hypothetical protein ACK3SF_01145 [Candidatus Nanosalina sp. VS9-1]|uniref:hypothetical protein n=1 Tax=Candidatus Nanosalina sp. VS9-1 TaxID=3388566 RepID=UPI0039E0DD1A
MELPSLPERFEEGLERDLFFVAISLAVVLVFVGVNNFTTPDEPMNVGLTEIETNCFGIEAGTCIGLQMRDHTTYNYDNYTDPEPGTENYYRLVESELMLQAYNICESEEVTGMDWTSEASYDNMTGSEWLENENVELLECDKTTFRHLNASK